MSINSKKVSKVLSINNIWLPILVGILVPIFLYKKYTSESSKLDFSQFADIELSPLLVSTLFVVLRDIIFVYRLRTITQNRITWMNCLYIIILWDFSSAVTPSVAGGGVIVVFLLTREGIKFGESLAYVMIITIADNFFFMTVAPFAFYIKYFTDFGNTAFTSPIVGGSIKAVFFLGCGIVFFYTFIIAFSLWKNPKFFKRLMIFICHKIKFLRKWRSSAIDHGNDIILASESMKVQTKSYWAKIALFTILGFLFKYAVLNSMAYICISPTLQEHMVIFSNQVLLWIVMLLSPTPGSAGTAEFFFAELYYNLFTNHIIIIEVLWRFLTYYIHIIAGGIVLTQWLRTVKESKN